MNAHINMHYMLLLAHTYALKCCLVEIENWFYCQLSCWMCHKLPHRCVVLFSNISLLLLLSMSALLPAALYLQPLAAAAAKVSIASLSYHFSHGTKLAPSDIFKIFTLTAMITSTSVCKNNITVCLCHVVAARDPSFIPNNSALAPPPYQHTLKSIPGTLYS